MTTSPLGSTKAAAACAVAAGALFIGVQIGHPQVNTTTIQSTNVFIRDQLKLLMALLALIGLAGLYLSQIRRNGLLGLIGYLLLSLGFLAILCDEYVSSYLLPELAKSNPAYVNDLLVLGTSRGTSRGADVGLMDTVTSVRGILYLGGGLLFGIALFRAKVLARWACVLLAVSGLASVVLSLMPDAFYRLLAFPNGIAMIGLGYSLWRNAGAGGTTEASPVMIPGQRTSGDEASVASGAYRLVKLIWASPWVHPSPRYQLTFPRPRGGKVRRSGGMARRRLSSAERTSWVPGSSARLSSRSRHSGSTIPC